MLTIGPFGYDAADQCLWKDGERVELTPKTFAVLSCLVSNAGRLVTKDALIEAVWPKVCVTDAVLKVRIAELRRLLGETPGERRFIETLHRRGYRLVAPLGRTAEHPGARAELSSAPPDEGAAITVSNAGGEAPLVGREPCLERLCRHLDVAAAGRRRLVFVTGEAGAGKTALLGAFRERTEARADARITLGQCVEHHGAQEAFLPVLDALAKLCRGEDRALVTATLRRYAPTWLAQLPWLTPEGDGAPLVEELLGATRSRMSREFGLFCDVMTRERTLVFVLEDLHWCDCATVELLSWLASQQGAAKLLVVVSLRPSESSAPGRPLEALRRHHLSRDPSSQVPVEALSSADVERYLRHRLPSRSGHPETAAWLHRRTGGNPLFVVNLVAYLRERGFWPDENAAAPGELTEAMEAAVPDSLKCMIDIQIERLEPEERELLLAASIAGEVFCAGVLGAALEDDTDALDEACRRLSASGRLIRHFDVCELPDGSHTDRYTFIHVLYRDALSQSLSSRRRARLHQRAGAHKARVYAGSTHLIAGELVTHFERAGNAPMAVRFLCESADNARSRYANRAAACHLSGALALLERVPAEARVELELTLLEQRGLVHQAMADMDEAVADFERLIERARASGRVGTEVNASLRLASALSWTSRERCLVAVDEARRRCRYVDDDASRLSALGSCAYWNLLWRHWDERDARDCLRAAESVRERGREPGAGGMLARASYFLSLRSDYPRAASMAADGMSFSMTDGDSSEYLLALYFRCWALLHAGRWGELVDCLDEQAFRIADSNDHQFWHLMFTLLRSWLETLCGDHDAAYRSAAGALARAERHELPFGRLLGLVRLGFACQGLGRDAEALDAFTRCQAWLDGERVLMDWIVRIQMHEGLSRYWLKAGDLERARSAAEAALHLADGPGERTYAAQALESLASIAVASGDDRAADHALRKAFGVLKEGDAPLASWRVHATAARLAEARGDVQGAARLWSGSAGTLGRLLTSLDGRPTLRRAFESSAPVRAVLSAGHGKGIAPLRPPTATEAKALSA